MTDLQADVLRAIRIFGPCSNADIARKLKLPLHKTYRTLNVLTRAGYVVHPKLQVWDISQRGRELFDRMPNRPLALFSEAT